MAGRIPDSFIETLNDRMNIVDVIGTRVSLKKSGREYHGRCPFHDDSSPSFSVNPDKQVYHCFGCGASGGLISFIMEYDNMDFVSAVESLASLAGLQVPSEATDPEAGKRKVLYEILEMADQAFRKALKSNPSRERAVSYLKGRGLTGTIAHRFGLGYAPDGWRFLYDQFSADTLIKKKLLDAGLTVVSSQGREYDRFRERVMFPIRDIRGRTIAFGGRVLDDSKPKYLNSPETKLFRKSDTLYGLYEARQVCRSLDRVLVVEGYMDVVALSQFGIDFAVATLGTSLTSQHLDRLSRQTTQVIVCFDGDKAGRTAAKRALNTMLPFLSDEFSIRFLFLPDGHDPDSLVRGEGTDAFLSRLNDALPISEALIHLLSDDVDLTKIDGRARLTALALPKIAKIPVSIYRSLMLDSLSELSGTRRTDLDARLQDLQIEPIGGEEKPANTPGQGQAQEVDTDMARYDSLRPVRDDQFIDFSENVEPPLKIEDIPEAPSGLQFPNPDKPEPLANRLLWLLLQNPKLMTDPFTIPERSRLINIRALAQVFDWLTTSDNPTTVGLMGHFSGTELGRLLSRLLSREALFSEHSYQVEFQDGLNQLKKQLATESMRLLAEDAKRGKISAEDLHQALAAHKK
ncbi:MAG: DNA primase [Oceanospirillales bacterium TMED33]|nr:DNA primase [Gammaproteobacteria bacterium]RPG22447.1 MAG: DNA primase [Oceanospirillales bacterium TMED33]